MSHNMNNTRVAAPFRKKPRSRRPIVPRDDRPRITWAAAYPGGVDDRTKEVIDITLPNQPAQPPQERLRFLNATELGPYKIETILDLLGVIDGPEPKPARATSWTAVNEPAYEFKKSNYKNPVFTDLNVANDENWPYIPLDAVDVRKRLLQHEAVNSLKGLLETITQLKFNKVSLEDTKAKLDQEALSRLRHHQQKLSMADRHTFVQCIAHWYKECHEAAIHRRNTSLNVMYFHPQNSLDRGQNFDWPLERHMASFTHNNVNSCSVEDKNDPSIVYDSNGGTRLLDPSNPELFYDDRRVLQFPALPPYAKQPGFDQAMAVFNAMDQQVRTREKRYRDWVAFGQEQIHMFGEVYLSDTNSEVLCLPRPMGEGVWRITFQLKENPHDAIERIFQEPNFTQVYGDQRQEMLVALKAKLMTELGIEGSMYWRLNVWKRDLDLRALRREIGEKLKARWKFYLQHLAPAKLSPVTTHCAHPYCDFHQHRTMPGGTFRLNFLHETHLSQPLYWLPDLVDDPGTPGRAKDGQMWFCLSCIEDLFNGNGLIQGLLHSEEEDDQIRIEVSTPPIVTMWNTLPNIEIQKQWQDGLDNITATVLRKAAENSPRKRRDTSEVSTPATEPSTLIPTIKLGSKKRTNAELQMQEVDDHPAAPVPKKIFINLVTPERRAAKLAITAQLEKTTLNNNAAQGQKEVIDLISPERPIITNDTVRESCAQSNSNTTQRPPPDSRNEEDLSPDNLSGPAGLFLDFSQPQARLRQRDASQPEMKAIPKPRQYISPYPPVQSQPRGNLTPSMMTAARPKPRLPLPPRLSLNNPPPGLSPFAFILHSHIHAEQRYTPHTWTTLSPYEEHAITQWKNMCLRKSIFDVPNNRRFVLQECCGESGGLEDSGYDTLNYWGPDCLDAESDLLPGLVIEGRYVHGLLEADVDLDIWSGEEYTSSETADDDEEDDDQDVICLGDNGSGDLTGQRKGKGRQKDKHRPVRVLLKDVSYLDRNESKYTTNNTAHTNPRIRHVKPLNHILTSLDARVRDAWARVGYLPSKRQQWDGIAKKQINTSDRSTNERRSTRIKMVYKRSMSLSTSVVDDALLPEIDQRDWPRKSLWKKELMRDRLGARVQKKNVEAGDAMEVDGENGAPIEGENEVVE